MSQEQRLAKVEREIVVSNEHGLHARPAMQLVDLANRFQSDISIQRTTDCAEPTIADAKSVMAVITLAATKGTLLLLTADGQDAEQAADEISRLFAERFGEE
jgi:phosphotransferase system HPr (HPr) family protein